MKTKAEITMQWKPSGSQISYDLTIPKGTRVMPTTGNQYFVDDLSWIHSRQRLLLHDAAHYGIRLNEDQVEE